MHGGAEEIQMWTGPSHENRDPRPELGMTSAQVSGVETDSIGTSQQEPCSTLRDRSPRAVLLSHLSMNFWKMRPRRFWQISSM